MSQGVETTNRVVGINWGSTNLRAWLIAPDRSVLDRAEGPGGVAELTRDEMCRCIEALAARWGRSCDYWASGMIGSAIGWTDAGYRETPSSLADLAAAAVLTEIGGCSVRIVPGLACTGPHGAPDVMRGEELELFGLLAGGAEMPHEALVLLPGTHSKWVLWRDGGIANFFTSMAGEIFDRMTASGLLASITDGMGEPGDAFDEGVRRARNSGLDSATLAFEARARALRQNLTPRDAASRFRGALLGAEIADARRLYPMLGKVPLTLIGSAATCALYARALALEGMHARTVPSGECCAAGYAKLARSVTTAIAA